MRSIFHASLLLPGLLLAGLLQGPLHGYATDPASDDQSGDATQTAASTTPAPYPAEFYELIKTVILPLVLINKRQQKFIYDRVYEEDIRDRIEPEFLKRSLTNKQIQRATLMDLLHHPTLVKQILDLYGLYFIEAMYAFEIGLYEPIPEAGPDVPGFIDEGLITSDAEPREDCQCTASNPTGTRVTPQTTANARQLGVNDEQGNVYYNKELQQFANGRNGEPFPVLSRIMNRVRPLAPLGLRPAQPLLARNFAASFSVASGAPRPLVSQDQYLRGQTDKNDQGASQTTNDLSSRNDVKTKRETTTSHDSGSSSARRKGATNNRRHKHSRRHAPRQTRWSQNEDFKGNFDRSINGKYVGYVLDGSTEEETRYMRLDPHQRWDNPNRDSTRKIVIDPLPSGRTYLYEPPVYEVDETPNGLHFYPRYANLPGAQGATPYNGESARIRAAPDTKPTSPPPNRAVEDTQHSSSSYPTVYYRTCNRGDKNCLYAFEGNNQGRFGEDESSYDQDTTDADYDDASNEAKTKGDSTNSQKTNDDQWKHPGAALTRSNARNTNDGISASSEAYVVSGNVPQSSAVSGSAPGLPGIIPPLFEGEPTPILPAIGHSVRGRLRDLISRTSPVTFQRRVVAQ